MNLSKKKGKEGRVEGAVGSLVSLPPITQWDQEIEVLGPRWDRAKGVTAAGLMTPSPGPICAVSFHRNHTETVRRSQVENPPVSHVENEYSQPPRNSRVSAYPGKHQWLLLLGRRSRDRPKREGRSLGEVELNCLRDSGHSRVWKGYSLNGPLTWREGGRWQAINTSTAVTSQARFSAGPCGLAGK